MEALLIKHSNPSPVRKKHPPPEAVLKCTMSPIFGTLPRIQRKSVCPCDGGCPACVSTVQPKLTISQPNDPYEQEADRVADEVMRMPEPVLQKEYTPCAAGEKLNIQNNGPDHTSDSLIPNDFVPYLGPGRPLDKNTRDYFKPRFGMDFSRVRIHTDAVAGQSARALSAKAYTIGSDIRFNEGQYQPNSQSGKDLLAHELTHIIQQGKQAETIHRRAYPGGDPIHDDLLDQFSRETGIPRSEASQHSSEYEAWLLHRPNARSSSVPSSSPPTSAPAPTYGTACSGGSTDPCQQSRCSFPVTGINADLRRAISYVESAIAALGSTPLSVETIRALDWYFSSHTAQTAATVLARLTCIKSELQDTLTNSRFGCDPGYPGDAIAYVCVGSTTPCQSTHTNVCLTNRYFGRSERVRAEVMIHECGHRAGLSAGSPDIYDFTWRFMFMNTADSLMNTDSYALFAPSVTEGVRTTLYGFPYLFGLSGGVAVPSAGVAGWQARLYLGTEFQNPVLGVFNPTIGIGLALIGETSTGGTSAIVSPPSFLASLVAGFRLTNPRPGSAGSGYASFFGGPAIVVPFPGAGRSSHVQMGGEAGMGIGYRWRWLDVSAGINYAYDPTRETGMQHLFIPNLSITFAPDFTQFPSSH
jgi:hypothetical protein